MAYDLEEQEQIEAIKGWWQDNGKLVMVGVLVCLLAIAGFQGWRYYRAQQSALAAAKAGVNTGELEEAKKHLQWTIENAKEEEMRDVARLRLAGVLLDEK